MGITEGDIVWLFLLLYFCVHYLIHDVVQWSLLNVVSVPCVLFCIVLCWYHSSCWLATLLCYLLVLFCSVLYAMLSLRSCTKHVASHHFASHHHLSNPICTCNLGVEELKLLCRLLAMTNSEGYFSGMKYTTNSMNASNVFWLAGNVSATEFHILTTCEWLRLPMSSYVNLRLDKYGSLIWHNDKLKDVEQGKV